MYRITEKLPSLTRHQGVRLQQANVPVLRNCRRYYDTNTSSKKGGLGKSLFYGVAVTSVVCGGVIGYAKFDGKFRKKLNEIVPGSDAFIRFISQEEKSYGDNVKGLVSSSSGSMMNNINKMVGKGESSEGSKSGIPVPPSLLKTTKVTPETAPVKKEPQSAVKKEPSTPVSKSIQNEESRVTSNKVTPTSKSENKKPSPKTEKKTDFQKYDLSALEKEVVHTVKLAMMGYNSAVENLKEYKNEVADLIEKTVQNEDHNIWFRIKEKSNQKDRIVELAENKGNEAMQKIEHLKLLINDPKTDLDEEVKITIESNIKTALNDLVYTKALFTQERSTSSVTEKYSKKVEESRHALSKELGLLFPSLVVDSKAVVSDEDLDLFVLYTCQLLNFYQKEFQKLETIGKSKIEAIIEQSKAGNPEVIKGMIEVETEKIRRELAQEILKKEVQLTAEYEKELKTQLLRQAEVHADYLQEVVQLKNKEMQRKLKQNADEKAENMKMTYNMQLARIIGRMKGLDVALKDKEVSEKQAKRSQLLWNACQSLILSIKSGTNTKSWEVQLKPLQTEVSAISKAAADEDTLVQAVIASIPQEAVSRGVFSELALKDRFLNVEKVAYRVANLSDGYVSLPRIFLSYLQSFLLIKTAKPIPVAELLNEPFDVSSLDNYDVLSRARYWIDRGDFEQCLKYMNLLKGASRTIAKEWMNETRIFLETQQAANLLLSHAVYSSFIYLQNLS